MALCNASVCEKILGDLKRFCEQNNWSYRYIEDIRQLNKTPRQKPENIVNYRPVPEEYIQKLKVMRNSQKL
jgi:hypothetical protein